MKLGIATIRYGDQVVGGAESAIRGLAEAAVTHLGWTVDVFTTCALEATTWENDLPEGSSKLNGVTVNRFRSTTHRDPRYLQYSETIRLFPRSVPERDARAYVTFAGPQCPDMIDAATDSDCDVVAFTPYLFWPSVYGIPRLGRRAIFHPAAHDEGELDLVNVGEAFTSCGGFAYYTRAERDLVLDHYHVGSIPNSVVGIGIDGPQNSDAIQPFDAAAPYVCYLGRVERLKGAVTLVDCFIEHKNRNPGPLKLVVAGPPSAEVSRHPDVISLGSVDEATKWSVLKGARFLINPSAFESFSLVLFEAWLMGTPVVVNGRCPATVEHVEASNGGGVFHDYADLEAWFLAAQRGDEALAQLGANGRTYASSGFSWPAVAERYDRLCNAVLARW